MALTRPNKYMPDKASAGYAAINGRDVISSEVVDYIVANDNTAFKVRSNTSAENPTTYISTPFIFSVGGNSPLVGFYITIYDVINNSIVFRSENVLLEENIYPINYKGEEVRIKVYIPELDKNGNPYIDNKPWSNYKWTATVVWMDVDSNSPTGLVEKRLTGPEAYFESRETLRIGKIRCDNGNEFQPGNGYLEITSIRHKFSAIEITPSITQVPISYFKWDLYDAHGILIYTTGIVNSPDVQFEYDGFLPLNYTLTLTVVNIANNKITIEIPLIYNTIIEMLDTRLNVVNLSLESCLHVSWDSNELSEEMILKGYILNADEIIGYELYRQKKGENFIRHLFSFSPNAYEFYDYNVANESEYIYYLYPIIKKSNHESVYSPVYVTTMKYNEFGYLEEEFHKVSFNGWFLLVLEPNPNQREGVYRVAKLFNWVADVRADNIRNNTSISINNNFSRYPRVQRSKSNYLIIPLQGLIGYIDCKTNEFIDDQKIIDEVRELTTLDNVMVLKNSKGAIMNVVPLGDISFSFNERVDKILTSMSMEFVEVGSVDNISIINKVSNPQWMFTLTGYQPIGSPSVNLVGHKVEPQTIFTPSNITIE